MQETQYLDFHLSDYDHENERHAQVGVDLEQLIVSMDRSVETNADYLATDAEVPEDWSDEHNFQFASGSSLLAFVTALLDELVSCCFAYFDEDGGSQIYNSDEARVLFTEKLNAVDVRKTIDGPDRLDGVDFEETIESLVNYPR